MTENELITKTKHNPLFIVLDRLQSRKSIHDIKPYVFYANIK